MGKQFSTFYIADRLYGIDVMKVQEITKELAMTDVPSAPIYVYGLINLRGQIATAIGLREMFGVQEGDSITKMNVICNVDGLLLSLLVDRIGDVVEVEENSFEPPPQTLPQSIKRFMSGIYKTPGALLSILDINKVSEAIIKEAV